MNITAYLKIIRPVNALMAGITVITGYWLSGYSFSSANALLLAAAAICSLGYGNVINDIKDFETDKTGHPGRPIPSGKITRRNALVFSIVLFAAAIIFSFMLSTAHFIGTIIPLIILTSYSLFFKQTPLAGNIIVSLLTGYTLLFGAIGTERITHILLPAASALLLNFCREIIKDVQDKKADEICGIKTTAVFSKKILTVILISANLPYLITLVLPWFIGHFGHLYILTGAAVILPLHFWWQYIVFKNSLGKNLNYASLILKIEMLGGISALIIDRSSSLF